MFNVLPKNLKDQIKKQYNLRRFIVALNFVIFIQVFVLIVFLPSWFISYYKQKDSSAEVAKSENAQFSEEASRLSGEISSINKKLEIISKTQTGFSPTQILDSILEQKGSAVSLGEVTYSKSSPMEVKITINGTANQRESLLLFVKKLETSKLYTKVDSPISNFTKDKDINFSLFLTMKI